VITYHEREVWNSKAVRMTTLEGLYYTDLSQFQSGKTETEFIRISKAPEP